MSFGDWGLLLLLATFWGTTFFFIEIALRDLPPFTIVLGRVGLAALALALLVKVRGLRLPTTAGVWGALAVMALLNNVLPFSLIVAGQTEIDSGLAAVLNATTPFFSIVLAHYLTRDERMTGNRVAGIGLGIAGVVVLVGPEVLSGLGRQGMGQLAILGAGLCYACAAIYGRRFRALSPAVVAAGQVIAATALLLPIALVVDRPWTLRPDTLAWGALISLAIPGTALAYILYFRLLATAGATNLMLVTLIIPVVAVALGVTLLGESLSAGTMAGMLLILGGLIVIDGRILGPISRRG